jgi:hypothetical protein
MTLVHIRGQTHRIEEFDFLEKTDNLGFFFDKCTHLGKLFTIKSLPIAHEELALTLAPTLEPTPIHKIIWEYYCTDAIPSSPLSFSATDDAKSLLHFAKKSKVGKNSATVLDREIRSSHEIACDNIEIEASFLSLLNLQLDKLSSSMTRQCEGKLHLKPHKLIIYSPGDFFAPHMDSLHDGNKNMIMTMSVEIFVPCEKKEEKYNSNYYGYGYNTTQKTRVVEVARSGGNLFIQQPGTHAHAHEVVGTTPVPEDYFKIPEADHYSNIRTALFYHDLSHCVSTLQGDGHKLVLTCDVIRSKIEHSIATATRSQKRKSHSDVMDYKIKMFNIGVERVLKSEFKRLGFFLTHKYFCDIPDSSNLKGFDITLYNMLSTRCSSIDIIPICIEDGNLYHKDLLSVLEMSSPFSTLYRDVEDDEDDEEDYEEEGDNENEEEEKGEDEKEVKKNKQIKMLDLMKKGWFIKGKDKLSPIFDNTGATKSIKNTAQYRLGDVAFVKLSTKSSTKIYSGDQEVHLGNEGFSGDIYDCLAIIGDIDTAKKQKKKKN